MPLVTNESEYASEWGAAGNRGHRVCFIRADSQHTQLSGETKAPVPPNGSVEYAPMFAGPAGACEFSSSPSECHWSSTGRCTACASESLLLCAACERRQRTTSPTALTTLSPSVVQRSR